MPTPKIDLSRLPITDATLYGRNDELQLLQASWEDSSTKILSFIAWGGVGKSALVNTWLNNMEAKDFYGAQRVYGWSFYSQGTREQGQSSADGFFNDAFKWFGYTGEIPKSQHEKGRLLATIIAEPKTQNSKFTLSEAEGHKTLLILDGLEPLQYPPGEMHGRLKDPAMAAFLRTLVRNLDGLCVITSRVFVADLKNTDGRSSRTHPLSQLSEAAGIAVLKSYGLKGPQAEFAKAVEEFKGHALALNLVGSYLDAFHEGNIQQRDLIEDLTDDETHGGHARRVMESYEKVFLRRKNFFSRNEYGPELNILYILGLFDRPASKEAIDILRKKPVIKGLTNKLQGISEKDWQKALNHLQDLRLITPKASSKPGSLDCHPLIREHFGKNLQKKHPKAWTQAQFRLYEYYKNLPEQELPNTLEDMEPLFTAVRHGCLAGKYFLVVAELFVTRLKIQNELSSIKQVGGYNHFLASLAWFFEEPWKKFIPIFYDQSFGIVGQNLRATIINHAAFCLMAIGRLKEALDLFQSGIKMRIDNEDWQNAAIVSKNISESYLLLGKIELAKEFGEKCIDFIDRSNIEVFNREFIRTNSRAFLGYVNLQKGDIEQAEFLFEEAEKIHKSRNHFYPVLYSTPAYYLHSFLLEKGDNNKVLKQCQIILDLDTPGDPNLDRSLVKLNIGKTLTLQLITSMSKSDLKESYLYLTQAVKGLRKAGTQHYLIHGLLARAALHRHTQTFPKAWEDLDETLEIATYGQMRLHLTDYHLEAARLVQAQLAAGGESFEVLEEGETLQLSKEEMQTRFGRHVAEAERLVEETGYHRRDGEVRSLKV